MFFFSLFNLFLFFSFLKPNLFYKWLDDTYENRAAISERDALSENLSQNLAAEKFVPLILLPCWQFHSKSLKACNFANFLATFTKSS